MKRWRSAVTAIASPVLALATAVALMVTLLEALLIGDANAQTTTATNVPATASPVVGMVQGLVGLVIVVGLIFAIGWATRKFGPRTRASGIVQVVGGASVGPRERVVVVRFGQQTLLLGVAPGQVSLLHAAEPGDPVADPGTDAAAPRFVDRLRAARSGA